MDALPPSVATGAQVTTAVIAMEGIGADAARKSYKKAVEGLDPNDSTGWESTKVDARRRTPPLTRTVIEATRQDTGPRPGSVGHADRTNPNANKGAKILGRIGRGSAAASVLCHKWVELKLLGFVDRRQSLSGPLDLGQDVFALRGPPARSRMVVVCRQVAHDLAPQPGNAGEAAVANRGGQIGEEALDQVEPGTRRWREVHLEPRVKGDTQTT